MIEIIKNKKCSCGKIHNASVKSIITGKGAINEVISQINEYSAKKVFVIADKNTYKAAGERLCGILKDAGIAFTLYVLPWEKPAPNEETVGSVMLSFDPECDLIIGVGSGVINDVGKITAKVSGKPYVIVATAPSMDGYASESASMERGGLKVSIPCTCPNVIIGDTDILKNAPLKMLRAGLGDMVAKYISICEWRISSLITGEYYCEEVARLVRSARNKCTANAAGLVKRDEEAVQSVFEGLVQGGLAMTYAGLSRPASGVEHYFSHIWDMRGLEFGTNCDLHGLQCGVATRISLKLYEKFKTVPPNKEKALKYFETFNYGEYFGKLSEFIGRAAESMKENEIKEKKYDLNKHRERLDVILKNYDGILKIIEEELPSPKQLDEIFDLAGLPKTAAEIGTEEKILPNTFEATKDIRDKYVLSRLCADLGIVEDMKKYIKGGKF